MRQACRPAFRHDMLLFKLSCIFLIKDYCAAGVKVLTVQQLLSLDFAGRCLLWPPDLAGVYSERLLRPDK